MSENKDVVYQVITDKIIALLDKGVVPWHRPWKSRGGSIARNAWGRPYRGINVFILATESMMHEYKSSFWLTFNQISERGGKVNENEHGTVVVFWKRLLVEAKDPDTNETVKKTIPLLRYFRVFNLDQTTGVKLTKKQAAEATAVEDIDTDEDVSAIDDAEAILASYLVRDDAPALVEGRNDKAYYSPSLDVIHLPARSSFETSEGFYGTAFHEVTHSTGATKRCNRKGIVTFDHFGSGQYAQEELVAELGSAFLCAESGIDNTVENSASYIASWRRVLSTDPKIIVNAAAQAQKAADYVLGTTFENGSEE